MATLSCDLFTGCVCDYIYYWDPTASICKVKGKSGDACLLGLDKQCRTDLGI